MSKIKTWFKRNTKGGLDNYLRDVDLDISGVEDPEKRAKLRLDFVKLVEQILMGLPQHQETAGQNIKVIVSPIEASENEDA